MDFETALLLVILALAIFAGVMLFWSWLERRRYRRTSVLANLPTPPAPARRKLPAPTVSETTAEYLRRTNYGMF